MGNISDRFGFMLAVGDLLWAPFVYSLQARLPYFQLKDLGHAWSAVILAVDFLGYYIFRTSNNEKNEFRNGSNLKSACEANLHIGTDRAASQHQISSL